jgi:membrane protease YdiL (CAAX protease family)
VLGSAAVFALLHFQALQFPGLFVFGVVLASLTLALGRLGPAVWAHMAFNASTVAVLYWDSR